MATLPIKRKPPPPPRQLRGGKLSIMPMVRGVILCTVLLVASCCISVVDRESYWRSTRVCRKHTSTSPSYTCIRILPRSDLCSPATHQGARCPRAPRSIKATFKINYRWRQIIQVRNVRILSHHNNNRKGSLCVPYLHNIPTYKA